jgi:hypothetical protein
VIFIGEQREVQAVLFLKALELLRGVRRDAQHHGIRVGVLALVVTHPARLRRATRRVCLGIEVHDHRLAAKV